MLLVPVVRLPVNILLIDCGKSSVRNGSDVCLAWAGDNQLCPCLVKLDPIFFLIINVKNTCLKRDTNAMLFYLEFIFCKHSGHCSCDQAN